ncbi:MAG: AMP-binding protein [Paracoccaceae bacterium]
MTLSALLIGNETLTAQCGEHLLGRGHGIAAVVTRSAEVARWATGRGLRVEGYGPDLAQRLPQADWLLSIANLTVLPAAVLARATRGAVNFHDGPLPAHAGLNAPVWAILGGEAEHGITWHLIEGGVDEGRILEDRRFAIAADDTALTLNTRCFEAGMESFPAVLAQLETTPQPRPQPAGPAQLHRGADRPAAFGRIDFAQPAAGVARLVRALDHGRYWNPLTTAKIDTGTRVLNVGSAEPAEGKGTPGSVLSATPEGLVVACGTGAVRLNRLTCQVRGGAVCPSTVTEPALAPLPPDEAARLTAALHEEAPPDAALRRALAQLAPLPLAVRPATTADWQSLPLAAPLAHLALAALRATGADHADLAVHAPGLPGYLAAWEPLRVTAGEIGPALAAVTEALARPATGWPLDLMTRDAALQGIAPPPLGLSAAGPVEGTAVTLTPTALHHDAARIDAPAAAALASRIAHVAAQIATAAPETALSALSALTGTERHEALTRWNATEKHHDRSLMVHTAFEAQAASTPDAPALAFEAETLTYTQLNARANRVAHTLIAMGVGPGTLVGLSTRRSLDLVVGALAIQKAGGAYVPMDPAYPAERLALSPRTARRR